MKVLFDSIVNTKTGSKTSVIPDRNQRQTINNKTPEPKLEQEEPLPPIE